MSCHVPDNHDAFEEYEAEMERTRRMRKRLAHEYGEDGREDREDEG